MKEKLLELVKEIKAGGLAERLYLAKNAEELVKIWNEFWKEHVNLLAKIRDWERAYNEQTKKCTIRDVHYIFEEYGTIRNSMEIAIFVRALEKVTESDLFEETNEFSFALGRIDNLFAKRVSDLSYYTLIRNIKIEEIFI